MSKLKDIKYSEEKRSYLYRLASKLASEVVASKADPTKELVRIASDYKLNDHEIDRVSQKANVLISEHHFRVNQSKDAEHPLSDPYLVKEAVRKVGSINKRINIDPDQMETKKNLESKESIASDYSRQPAEIVPIKIGSTYCEPSMAEKYAQSEVKIAEEVHKTRKQLHKYKVARDEIRSRMNRESSGINIAYRSIKEQLKKAWLSGNKEAFAELYVAGCIRFPKREKEIATNLFKMAMELEKEGVYGHDDLLKFSSVPEEYFTGQPRVVDSNRHILIELDTVTRNRNPVAKWTPIWQIVDDKVTYLVKKINVLENAQHEVRGSIESPDVKGKVEGQYLSHKNRFDIQSAHGSIYQIP
jgi:hypothetical protein